MYTEEDIRAAALAEIQSPQLALTEQFFAVHELHDTDPIRLVEKDGDRWKVYCGIKEQDYYWVVIVESESDRLVATWAYCNPHSRVYLVIQSPEVSPEAITTELSLPPSCVGRKGELVPGWAGSRAGRRNEEHMWWYEEPLPEATDFEDKLNSLLKVLITRETEIQNLADRASMCINVPQYMRSLSTYGLHLDQQQISLLARLRLEVDFDLYAFGPDFLEPEEMSQ